MGQTIFNRRVSYATMCGNVFLAEKMDGPHRTDFEIYRRILEDPAELTPLKTRQCIGLDPVFGKYLILHPLAKNVLKNLL